MTKGKKAALIVTIPFVVLLLIGFILAWIWMHKATSEFQGDMATLSI